MGKFISYLKTSSFRNNIIAAVLTVVVLLMVAFFSLRYYTKHGQGLNVPELKGLSFTQAVEKLEALGLRYQVDSVYIMDSPPGIVIDQDPNANTFVKDNRTIYLTINTRQAPIIKFPDIQGRTYLEANAILNNFGLKIGDTTYVADVSLNVVLKATFGGNSMARGQDIPKGSRVNLVLGDGKGAGEVDIPDLIGLTLSEAMFPLKQSSLNIGLVTYEGTITDSVGARIKKQTPAPADSLKKVPVGTQIDVILSNQ